MRRSVLMVVGVAVGLLSACSGSWRPTVAEVDGSAVGASEVIDVANTFRNDPVLIQGLQVDERALTEARVPGELAQEAVTTAIVERVLRRALERDGLEVTDEARETAWSETFNISKADLDRLPEPLSPAGRAYLERRADIQAMKDVYVAARPEAERAQALPELFARSAISVNPRYGEWDRTNLVVVGVGQTAPAGGNAAAGSS